METQNEAAAPAAVDEGAAAPAAATSQGDASGQQQAGGSDAPAPGDVSEEEIVDLRKSALEDQGEAFQLPARYVTLGETVYYGDGSGAVWPAMVVHVYDPSVTHDGNNSIVGAQGTPNVDLQVFKRKHICDVENVSYHQFNPPRSLNGWIFKA